MTKTKEAAVRVGRRLMRENKSAPSTQTLTLKEMDDNQLYHLADSVKQEQKIRAAMHARKKFLQGMPIWLVGQNGRLVEGKLQSINDHYVDAIVPVYKRRKKVDDSFPTWDRKYVIFKWTESNVRRVLNEFKWKLRKRVNNAYRIAHEYDHVLTKRLPDLELKCRKMLNKHASVQNK